MKIALIGATGMLGSDFLPVLEAQNTCVLPFRSNTLDITKPLQIKETLDKIQGLSHVINCAAYTNVDMCETNRTHALRLNAEAVGNLADYCAHRDIPLIHFSTDYVFDGTKNGAYEETDPCNPINFYGQSKLEGEKNIQTICSKFYIFRIQWLYGKNGKNFVDTLIQASKDKKHLDIVNDQWGSPTWTVEVARAVAFFLEAKPDYGIYHLSCEGHTTWFDFASYFLDYINSPCKLRPISTDQMPRPAKRPLNSKLSLNKLLDVRIIHPNHWQIAVKKYLHMLEKGKKHDTPKTPSISF